MLLKPLHQNLLIFFAILGLRGVLNHAMWRDEMTIWLIARDSQTWHDLFQVIRYEPHPALWYGCVYLLQYLTANPVAMQLLHWAIGLGAAYIFLRASPFSHWQKGLFLFGYLPFYEYLLISRNYSLGLLFGFGVCALWSQRQRNYLGLAVLLALMANCNAYSLFIALALGITLILEAVLPQDPQDACQAGIQNRGLSLVIFLTGIATAILCLIPPADNLEHGGLQGGWYVALDLHRLLATLARVWNGYVVVITAADSRFYSVLICGVLALGLLIIVLGSLLDRPLVLCFYLVATLQILLFTYTKFLGAQRHFGHLFIVLILALWLTRYYEPSQVLLDKLGGCGQAYGQFSRRYQVILVMGLLWAQLAGGVTAYLRDLAVPYSASRATASYIQQHGFDAWFLVGSQDVAVSPLSGYLRRQIYYPERQGLGSFVLFNRDRQAVDDHEILRQVQALTQAHDRILLILNHPLEVASEGLRLEPLAQFHESLIHNEKYDLYRVQGWDGAG